MKRKRAQEAFLERLRQAVQSLKHMKPGEVHVFSINASYGHYQIVIGPEQRGKERQEHKRPIEINGEIHHLFVSPRAVSIHPSRGQVMRNMKDTVIMRDLSIHLVDPKGDGEHLEREANNNLHARECINLAGDDGEKIIEEAGNDANLMLAAYRIVQQDILASLRAHREEQSEATE